MIIDFTASDGCSSIPGNDANEGDNKYYQDSKTVTNILVNLKVLLRNQNVKSFAHNGNSCSIMDNPFFNLLCWCQQAYYSLQCQ